MDLPKAKKMSELGENSSALSLEETDGAQVPDMKDVAEIARTQLTDMLASEEGKKDLVIQGELMTLLEHVTPIKFLKKYGMSVNFGLSVTSHTGEVIAVKLSRLHGESFPGGPG